MQYYRRKPLNLTASSRELLQANPASLLDGRPRSLSSSVDSRETEINPIESLVQPIPESILPTPQMADPAALLQQAANILEQELLPNLSPAANPGASWSLPGLTSETLTPDLLTNLHCFVDQFAKVMTERSRIEGLMPPTGSADDENQLPLLKSPIVQSGEVTRFSFKVHNDSERSVETQFFGTDLVSSTGERIPSSSISLMPQQLTLSADQVAEVSVQIQVPNGTSANTYFGQVIASNLSDLAAAVQLKVR
jgi:hypothetical protein